MSFKVSKVPHPPQGGEKTSRYDPFGAIAQREKRMREYESNPTFKPDVRYYKGSPSNVQHQKNRGLRFLKKKNQETEDEFYASIKARFANLQDVSDACEKVGVTMTTQDVAVPVSTRGIGFECARIHAISAKPDIRKHFAAPIPITTLYRVMLAAWNLSCVKI